MVRNFLILFLLATIGFMYVHRDSEKPYLEILNDYRTKGIQLVKGISDPEFRELLKGEISDKFDKVREQDWEGLQESLQESEVSEELTKKEVTSILSDFMNEDSGSSEEKKVRPLGLNLSWEKSIDRALSRAKSRDKLVMVDFSTTWCGWCKKLDKETFRDRDVMAMLNRNFILAKIDGDDNPDLVRKYNVRGYPNIVFLNAQGDVVYQQPGFLPPKAFRNLLKTVLNKAT